MEGDNFDSPSMYWRIELMEWLSLDLFVENIVLDSVVAVERIEHYYRTRQFRLHEYQFAALDLQTRWPYHKQLLKRQIN